MADAQVDGQPQIDTLAAGIKNLCAGVKTQSQEHIKQVQAYCATRLVLEGGFPPEWVLPRRPFASRKVNNAVFELSVQEKVKSTSEQRVLGGIKYKDVDVTVMVPGLGPALGISTKSTGNAFRNLTNRMEEALGECTNVHLMYPGFVFGFLHLIKFSKSFEAGSPQDASFDDKNQPLPGIRRYHDVLLALSGRNTITDPGMKYEAVGLLVYRCTKSGAEIWNEYPPKDSTVHFANFFRRLYDLYDLRFGYPDPDGPNIRKGWRLNGGGFPTSFDDQLRFAWEIRLAE
ncbi:MAG: hypothetical protein ABSG32_00940 [Terriglobia bacterium]|jgi:hypothetical protein